MSNPPTPPTPADVPDEAQHPRLVTRARLVPLAVLVVLAVVAAGIGLLNDGKVTGDLPAAAASTPSKDKGDRGGKGEQATAEQKAAERARKACRPGWSTGVKSEPWSAARRTASERTYKAAIKKENAGYIKGTNGNYLFSDLYANNFSQALGRVTQSSKKQKAWAKYFAKAQRLTEAQGGVFHVVVAPGTWEVHPGTLPKWAQSLRGSNTLTRLMKAHPDVPWIDVRKALLTASKKTTNVYIPVNSHWTSYGGYVAWQAIAKCLATDPGLDKVGVPPISSIKKDPNYNEFAGYGIKPGKKAWTVPVYADPLPSSTQTQLKDGSEAPYDPYGGIDALFLPAKVETPGAQSDQTLLVYRDSTGSALSPLWRYSYQTSYQYHHGVLSDPKPTALATAIATAHPDLFLYVIAERDLDGMPPRS
jgi:hypothetical protein